MKYTVTVDGDVFEIEVGPGERAWVNQQPHSVDLWHVGGDGEYSLLVDNRSYEVQVAGNAVGVSNVIVGRRSYRARLQRGHWATGAGAADAALPGALRSWLDRRPSTIVELTAPLPGLLVQVLVDEGEFVEEQDLVAVLESMKMNLELRAPRSGVVCDILVGSGEQVAQDQVLVAIDPGMPSYSKDSAPHKPPPNRP